MKLLKCDALLSNFAFNFNLRQYSKQWGTMPFFHQIQELEGIPVINIHMWWGGAG